HNSPASPRVQNPTIPFSCVPETAIPRALPSFPTRRSSDLLPPRSRSISSPDSPYAITSRHFSRSMGANRVYGSPLCRPPSSSTRSEEHTSELQSRFDLVCRLLLEKKKKLSKNTCQRYNAIQ